jgi:hypothetical protein
MYGYFVRPETLDADYCKFVSRFAAVDERVVACNRQVLKNGDLLKAALSTFPADFGALEELQCLPCSIFHLDRDCWERVISLWMRTFRQSTPMYLSLHLIPSLLFKFQHFIKE